MEQGRWVNQAQPQTLQIAVFLLYLDAVFVVLGLMGGAVSGIGLLLGAAAVGAGYGIANERKWGYWLGIAVSVFTLFPYARAILTFGPGVILASTAIVGFLFAVAQFALLVHPMSSSYQKLWFK